MNYDIPLDLSDDFMKLCNAARRGDLKAAQEAIAMGANINARDEFDYTPLILASLCGHYEVVQLLLESGALCERDTFQGERCLYNALNSHIRRLLLQYDYSKNTDPLQPLSSHITSLLTRQHPQTSDITLTAGAESFRLHKFILAARSPYFQRKLSLALETNTWRLTSSTPIEAVHIALRYLYLGEVPGDLGIGPSSRVSEDDVLKDIDKISKELDIESLWTGILGSSDRRLIRQWRQGEVGRGRNQLETWYQNNVLKQKIEVDSSKANDVKWIRDNSIHADVLLRADDEIEEGDISEDKQSAIPQNGIPVGPKEEKHAERLEKRRRSVLYPVNRAILIRSEYFLKMFSSWFQEAQVTEYLQIVPVDCKPEVLEVIINFLYTERAEFPLEIAIDVLYAADMLFIDKLKSKAAIIISTLGYGRGSTLIDRTHTMNGEEDDTEPINVYDVIHAGWVTRERRLEVFAARYLANRLEDYIEEPEFEELIKESASRIAKREETDTIELLDDIRYYLSERFRLRFEDVNLETLTQEDDDRVSPEDASHEPDRIKTLDGKIAADEFAADAINFRLLERKIDEVLERLNLDA